MQQIHYLPNVHQDTVCLQLDFWMDKEGVIQCEIEERYLIGWKVETYTEETISSPIVSGYNPQQGSGSKLAVRSPNGVWTCNGRDYESLEAMQKHLGDAYKDLWSR